MRWIGASAIAAICTIGYSPAAAAQVQDRATGLGQLLRPGDRVWVQIDTTDVRTGRVLGVGSGVLRLTSDVAEENISIDRIWQVQRKQNGIVLGTVIGAGVGLGLGVPLAMIGVNEGTSVAGPLLFMTGVGAAVGAGLDAVMWRKRTVYRRWQPALVARPILGPDRVGIVVSKVF
jgi:hypothetical protein